MADTATKSPEAIRIAEDENPKLRARDLADTLGISEAALVAARTGDGVTRIEAHPDQVIGKAAVALGEVMALTRNESCVHEKVGIYDNYQSGAHACLVLNDAIDLRLFPSHWQHAFMVEKQTDQGVRRSLQVFDAAGDAVHKIHLRETSDLDAWEKLRSELKHADQSQSVETTPRKPAETPKSNPDKLDILRTEWARMTDTHQFMRLTSKLRMNRLGAYRVAGEPFVRAVETGAVDMALKKAAGNGTEVMIFVGNRGCIQIHGGPIHKLQPMGPWQNVMDPGFNLHLRLDHIAEVWAVEKPTQRGPATSLEAFDAEGGLILQIFGHGKEGHDSRPAWRAIVESLPGTAAKETV